MSTIDTCKNVCPYHTSLSLPAVYHIPPDPNTVRPRTSAPVHQPPYISPRTSAPVHHRPGAEGRRGLIAGGGMGYGVGGEIVSPRFH